MSRRTSSLTGSKAGNLHTKESGTSRRGANTRRLAKASAGVVVLGVIAALAVLYLGAPQPPEAVAEQNDCPTPPSPEPGPGRPWEASLPVSTYCTVNTRTRNLFCAIPLAAVPRQGPDITMALYYNSAFVDPPSYASYDLVRNTGYDFGPGWTIAYSDQLVIHSPTLVTHIADDGTLTLYAWNGTRWVPPAGVHDILEQPFGGTSQWRIRHKDQSAEEFFRCPNEDFARLVSVRDSSGLVLEINYEPALNPLCLGSPARRLARIGSAENSQRLELQPHPEHPDELSTLIDPALAGESLGTRNWQFDYDNNGVNLTKIKDALQNQILLTYESERLESMTDWTSNTYGDTYTFTYNQVGGISRVQDPDLNEPGQPDLFQNFDTICASGRITTFYYDRRASATVPLGAPWEFLYNQTQTLAWPEGNLERTKTPIPDTYTTLGYDADRNLVSVKDAANVEVTATYDDRGNVLTVTAPFGTQTWTYDCCNSVRTYTDAIGETTTLDYEFSPSVCQPGAGGICPVVDPALPPTNSGLVTRVTEPEVGFPPEIPVESAETTFEYIPGTGQLITVTDPNGVVTRMQYDEFGTLADYSEGEIPSQVAGGSVPVYQQSPVYDSAGRLNSTTNTYDSLGTRWTYDLNDLITVSECRSIPEEVAGDPPVNHYAQRPNGFPPPPSLPTNIITWETCLRLHDALWSAKGQLLEKTMERKRNQITETRRNTNDYDNRNYCRGTSEAPEGMTVVRAFDFEYRADLGYATREGPDSFSGSRGKTYVEWDTANRITYVRRGNQSTPLFEAEYTYWINGLPATATFGLNLKNPATRVVHSSIVVNYDVANRVEWIDHRNGPGADDSELRLGYTYRADDLPETITEIGADDLWIATTTFDYDARKRLIEERREGANAYWLTYTYDQGGNRKRKVDLLNETETLYDYDVDDPDPNDPNAPTYDSFNNRLERSTTYATTVSHPLLSTTWYYYTTSGNVHRVVTRDEGTMTMSLSGGSNNSATMLGEGELGEAEAEAALLSGEYELEGGSLASGGGSMALLGGGCPGAKWYNSIRFEYDKTGAEVSYVFGERWRSTGTEDGPCGTVTMTFAREFRYDSPRQRYFVRELDPASAQAGNIVRSLFVPDQWSDYSGDAIYADWETNASGLTDTRLFEPGLARAFPDTSSPGTRYEHTDLLGTSKADSYATDESSLVAREVFTAFGERVCSLDGGSTCPAYNASERYGYVGAHGYQANKSFPFLHVGARYYDPGSGRFLQRDPIGIRGGLNVYAYAGNSPTARIDPDGRLWNGLIGGVIGGITGAITGGATGGWQGAAAGVIGGFIGGALGGFGLPPALAGAVSGAISAGISSWVNALGPGRTAISMAIGGGLGAGGGWMTGKVTVSHGESLSYGARVGVGFSSGLGRAGANIYINGLPGAIYDSADKLPRRSSPGGPPFHSPPGG